MPSGKSPYNEWSIEKGDYVRKDLSKQDMIYKSNMKPVTKVIIAGLVLLAIILGFVLKMKMSHFSA
ncbi:MAG: hypothetical protein ACM3QX_05660 [Syntrophomonadaceae bacterium]